MKEKKYPDLSSTALHIIAMFCMLLDHMWATVTPGNPWMTCVGRIAFPLFAFMIVEGFFHTKNLKKYFLRMFLFALIAEIPFDLMYGSMAFYPYHQNVLWTFLLALLGVWVIDTVRKREKRWLTLPVSVLTVAVCTALGFLTMVDFYGVGVLTVFLFYFFRGRKWWCLLGQFAGMYYLNVELLGGLCYQFTVFGHTFEVVRQGFALLALIPIWLYRGRQGCHSKPFQYFCYAFYPLHCLILYLLLHFA